MPKYATRGYLLLATLIVVGIVGLGRPGEWLPACPVRHNPPELPTHSTHSPTVCILLS